MRNLLVAQSGGPTAAINATVAGVVSCAVLSGKVDHIYGAVNGIEGVLAEKFLDLGKKLDSAEKISLLMQTPAAALGSCRYKLGDPEENKEDFEEILQIFRRHEIRYFIYIGGNDSMDTVLKLSDYAKKINSDVKIIGIPKTIDNDLCMTDHTPGFGSAAKYIASSMLEIAHDTFIYAVKSVTIVEIMGRDAGWLTAASALARNEYNTAPQFIYLPEVDFDKDKFVADIKEALAHTNNVIVAVSEGIHDADGSYITSSKAACDQFGHQQLSGAGKALEFIVKENIGVKVRSVEVNVLQHCASHLASLTDIEESFAQGKKGVTIAAEGVTASMVCLKRISNDPYQVEYTYSAIKDIANEAKSVPREWINDAGNDVKPELIEYLKPLIQGETAVAYKNGLPDYMDVSHLHKCN